MSESNKSFRIRTKVGEDTFIPLKLDNEYEVLEILSLKVNQKGEYRYHNSQYGVIVGRVLANNGFGVPNARLSLFIPKENTDDIFENEFYPYVNVGDKNREGVRYNLLPNNQRDNCHQVVGTFPSKREVLDNNGVIEVFDKYYKYTTRTNDAGDYMFYGIPTGDYIIHMDLDISDCGRLSQRPRDFIYKGYTMEQFESPNQFKTSKELSSLSQIFTQDIAVNVKPFWGNSNEGTDVGITRTDINVAFKFEPTCVFIGSIVTDNPNEGISKKCVPTDKMGDMRDLVTGRGTIEIIRKKIDNTIEELQIKGKQLINGDGVWCFQIPMNLDYITTDEFGNTVPTDNPEKGIPTRCEVRFRMSLEENNSETNKYHRGKVLVPHNPMNEQELDYEFGSKTKDSSFKSLMWNNVYTIKSFIPRFQKSKQIKTDKFSGIKNVNIHGQNNPMPYNNIRIKLPFMFWLTCSIIKTLVRIVQIINVLKVGLMTALGNLVDKFTLPYAYISNSFCPDMEYWYFAPGMNTKSADANKEKRDCLKWEEESVCLTFKRIYEDITNETDENNINEITFVRWASKEDPIPNLPTILTSQEFLLTMTGTTGQATDYYCSNNWKTETVSQILTYSKDEMSVDVQNAISNLDIKVKLTDDISYLMQCVEMNLAQEYEVVKFDFYNDWLNGVIYLPRWARDVKYKRKRKQGDKYVITKVKGCINGIAGNRVSRRFMQQCSMEYDSNLKISTLDYGCGGKKLRCHQNNGSDYVEVFGDKMGIVQEQKTMLDDNVYYLKPWEFRNGGKKIPLFATDIVMLGSLLSCNEYGFPSVFDSYVSTTYQLPPNLALTNVDEDSYIYSYTGKEGEGKEGDIKGVPPTLMEIMNWRCGEKCNEGGVRATQGLMDSAAKKIPSYEDIENMLKEYENIYDENGEKYRFEYEDVFPITEMSGIEWGFTGPSQLPAGKDVTDDKMFAPGGHFMGLSCANAETNVRSCVNLKRACEIGTTLSTRYEIPLSQEKIKEEDIVNYLFITPSGLITKEQIEDVTIRSAFATMNQNGLKTVVNPVTNYKEYDFRYLLPDSFDGSLSGFVKQNSEYYNSNIEVRQDEYWKNINDAELLFEKGHTITRNIESTSDDYNSFRWGDKPMFLKVNRMPVYLNSFYFYFGLVNGHTALDEFKSQYFASCGVSNLIQQNGYVTYDIDINVYSALTYNVKIETHGMSSEVMTYQLQAIGEDTPKVYKGTVNTKDFIIRDVKMGIYQLSIVDEDNNEIVQEINVGNGIFSIDYNKDSVIGYTIAENLKENINDYEDNPNGGYVNGTFKISINAENKWEYNPTDFKVYVYESENRLTGVTIDSSISLYDGKGLWLFGPGQYEIYIYNKNDTNKMRFKYDSFYVADGVKIDCDIILNCGSDNVKYGDERLKPNWCSEIPEDFDLFKGTVNQNRENVPFSLGVYCTDKTFKDVFVGQKERLNENGEFVADGELEFLDNFENIKVFNREKHFYYTARKGGVFATNMWTAVIIGNKIENIKGFNTSTGIDSYIGSEQYFLGIQGETTKIIKITSRRIIENNPFNDGDIKIVHMLELNAFSQPFAVEVSLLLDQNNKEIDSKFISYTGFEGNEDIVYNKDSVIVKQDKDDALSKKIEFSDDGGTFNANTFGNIVKYSHNMEDDKITLFIKNVDPTFKEYYKYYYQNNEVNIDILEGESSNAFNYGTIMDTKVTATVGLGNYYCYGKVIKELNNLSTCGDSKCIMGKYYDEHNFSFKSERLNISFKNIYTGEKNSKWIWYEGDGETKIETWDPDEDNKKLSLISLKFPPVTELYIEVSSFEGNQYREGMVGTGVPISTDTGYIKADNINIFSGDIYYDGNDMNEFYIVKINFGDIVIDFTPATTEDVKTQNTGVMVKLSGVGNYPYSKNMSILLSRDELFKLDGIEFLVADNIVANSVAPNTSGNDEQIELTVEFENVETGEKIIKSEIDGEVVTNVSLDKATNDSGDTVINGVEVSTDTLEAEAIITGYTGVTVKVSGKYNKLKGDAIVVIFGNGVKIGEILFDSDEVTETFNFDLIEGDDFVVTSHVINNPNYKTLDE